MGRFEDLTGQKFGRLTVIDRCENLKGRVAWNCQCDCGNYVKVISKSLKSGNTSSCGCLHKEKVAKQFSKNISNQRFGNLIALEPTSERKHGSVIWKCICDCGNIHFTTAEQLLAGHCKSCGCIRSRGNQKVKQLLQQNNFIFVDEYPVIINKQVYYFDFAIFDTDNNIKYFIEYDGILHFQQDKYHGWNNKENWERTQKNDKIKNEYCEKNNIKLIRIPYTDYEKINIEYINERVNK